MPTNTATTLDEIKVLKSKLEADLTKLVIEFEELTGTNVRSLNYQKEETFVEGVDTPIMVVREVNVSAFV